MCGWEALPPVHGFGVSSPLTLRYPLASVDASNFAAGERWGRVAHGLLNSRTEQGSPTTRIESGRLLAQMGFLRAWQKVERAQTDLWRERGVRFLPEMSALADRDEVTV
jgi:hypothetical protein